MPDWGPIHPLPGRFLSTSGSQRLGSHYNTFLWGAHATCTACLPHSNHFFAGLRWHSVHPWLRSHYNTHWLGAILLALYACPTSTTPADFILALHSSTAGEPVKTPSMLPFGDTPAFLGPTLTIPWPMDGEVSLLGKSMCTTPEAYEGSALKGGQYPLGYIQPYHLSTSLPIHHHGGHLPQQPYPCMCNRGLIPT